VRRLTILAAVGVASCGLPTVEGKISMTQAACLEKAQQFFPKLGILGDGLVLGGIEANENAVDGETDLGQFRMVSTGKFIWDWPLPSPLTGKLTCSGDFNLSRIETLNFNGLDKRPTANEVWDIPSLQSVPFEADIKVEAALENTRD
jgi:hypothetical protein